MMMAVGVQPRHRGRGEVSLRSSSRMGLRLGGVRGRVVYHFFGLDLASGSVLE